MLHIRFTASAAAAAVVLALALSPATARPCDHGDAGCVVSAQTEPMKLENFMKTWKPVANTNSVATTKKSKKSKSAKKPAVKEVASEPAVAETTPPPPPVPVPSPTETLAANPDQSVETDAVAIAPFDEANEIDALAGTAPSKVQVVAFNEVNEIDLAAPPPPLAAETVGQSVLAELPDENNSWMAKLLLAIAGTIALAGATRFFVA